MAMNLNESIVEHKIDVALDPAYNGPLETGMVMVASANISASGGQLAKPCTGASGEIVLGVLKLSENSQESVPTIEDLTVPAASPFTLTLREVPTAVNAVRAVAADGSDITVVAGSSPGAGEIALDAATGKLTADSSLAETKFRITYRYLISAQALAKFGRRSVNQGAEQLHGQVTIMKGNSKLLVSNFDTAAAFAPTETVTCAAGGKVTIGGSGTAVGTCFQAPVLKLTPGIEQAFIGIQINI